MRIVRKLLVAITQVESDEDPTYSGLNPPGLIHLGVCTFPERLIEVGGDPPKSLEATERLSNNLVEFEEGTLSAV